MRFEEIDPIDSINQSLQEKSARAAAHYAAERHAEQERRRHRAAHHPVRYIPLRPSPPPKPRADPDQIMPELSHQFADWALRHDIPMDVHHSVTKWFVPKRTNGWAFGGHHSESETYDYSYTSTMWQTWFISDRGEPMALSREERVGPDTLSPLWDFHYRAAINRLQEKILRICGAYGITWP